MGVDVGVQPLWVNAGGGEGHDGRVAGRECVRFRQKPPSRLPQRLPRLHSQPQRVSFLPRRVPQRLPVSAPWTRVVPEGVPWSLPLLFSLPVFLNSCWDLVLLKLGRLNSGLLYH